MKYTKEDLERAAEFARNKAYGLKALAKLIADVRRGERERSAQKLELLVLTALRNPHLAVSEVEELVEGLIEGLRGANETRG